jgi:dihydropyrimidinase
MRTLIKNGEIVTAVDRYPADVLVDQEQVVAIGRDLGQSSLAQGAQIIDAAGKLVIPGGIDVHVHMELPFMGTYSIDDFESGSVAALCGGTTTLVDFVIPKRGDGLLETLEIWNQRHQGKPAVDYTYHMAVTSWSEKIHAEIPQVVERGITSFKVFMAYKGILQLDDDELFQTLLRVREVGGLVTVHAVNGDVQNRLAERFAAAGQLTPHYHPLAQPPEAEGEAAGRVIDLAAIAKQPVYIVHTTCDEALQRVIAARRRGQEAYSETCPQYLLLDDSLYDLPGFEGAKYVLSPPLRKAKDQAALWQGLADGSVVTVGTDHCSFKFAGQKEMGRDDFRKIPNGFNGIEERVNLLYTFGVRPGRISASKWVEVCAANPAKIFGLYPRKGTIAVGSDADLVVFDPQRHGSISAKTHHSRSDYNVYEGLRLEGMTDTVLLRGRVVYQNGQYCGGKGGGQFLKRCPL